MRRQFSRVAFVQTFRVFGVLTTVAALAISGLNLSTSAEPNTKPKPESKKEKDNDKKLKFVEQLSGFDHWVTSVAFSPDCKQLAVGSYETVQWFDAGKATKTASWKVAGGYVRSLAFLPGGEKLVVGAYQSASIWDVASGQKERDLPKHRGVVTRIVVSPDGKLLATSSDDETVRLIRIADGELIRSFAQDGEPVQGVAFSPDGKLLATALGDDTRVTRPGSAKLWNAETGETVRTFEGLLKAATAVAFTADGQRLIVTSVDEKAYVFETDSGKPLGFFGGHSRPVNCIVMSFDGKTAITGSGGRARGKNEIKLWHVADGEELAVADEHQAKVAALALSPDGKRLASVGYDQTAYLWDISSQSSNPAAAAVVAGDANSESAVGADNANKDNAVAESKPLKCGIIGLDTSHAIAFTKTLNAEKQRAEVAGCRLVAAYPKGSPDIESSVSRVPDYTEQMKKMGAEIVDSIDELVTRVDAVMLETNDGRPHYEQIIPVLKAGKPCFIDKPIAGSLTDAVAIFEAAKKYKTPIFSSSSLRFGKTTLAARAGSLGKITRCETSSPASLEKTHPDLFWYGIHGVESLFTVMGTGCVSVKRGTTADGKIEVVGQWTDGRVGIFREGQGYEGKATGDKGEGPVGSYDGYDPLLFEMIAFFRSGKPPVGELETLEIYAFMEAADESKRQNGASITLESVLAKARAEAAKKIVELK